MTGLRTLRQGRGNQQPSSGIGPKEVPDGRRIAFRRYLLVSSGISSTALGLALIVSFFATGFGESPAARLVAADHASVQVVSRGGHSGSVFLDATSVDLVAPEAVPGTGDISAQPPAAALDLAPRGERAPQPASPAVQPAPRATATPTGVIAPPGAAPQPVATPVAQPAAAAVTIGRINGVNLTFYDCLDQGFCGTMKYGKEVFEGAAACSWNLPEGTKFRIVGDPTKRTYVCEDRGLLEDTWVDIFFHDPEDGWKWQAAVGRYGTIEILRLP